MKKASSPAGKKLLTALIGSSLFWPWPAFAAVDAAQEPPPAGQTAQETTADIRHEFALEGV